MSNTFIPFNHPFWTLLSFHHSYLDIQDLFRMTITNISTLHNTLWPCQLFYLIFILHYNIANSGQKEVKTIMKKLALICSNHQPTENSVIPTKSNSVANIIPYYYIISEADMIELFRRFNPHPPSSLLERLVYVKTPAMEQ